VAIRHKEANYIKESTAESIHMKLQELLVQERVLAEEEKQLKEMELQQLRRHMEMVNAGSAVDEDLAAAEIDEAVAYKVYKSYKSKVRAFFLSRDLLLCRGLLTLV